MWGLFGAFKCTWNILPPAADRRDHVFLVRILIGKALLLGQWERALVYDPLFEGGTIGD